MQQRRWCWLNHDRLKSTKRLHWIFIQWSLLVLFNLSKLDGQIYDIHHKDIPDDEKAKLYSASLNSYLDINKPTFLTKFESTAKESKDSEPANVGDDGFGDGSKDFKVTNFATFEAYQEQSGHI